ncbi:MAG: radical protein [Deltaproteobacteria bacterium]|nr:radical protein [Deltaproteobacteria bacterium]
MSKILGVIKTLATRRLNLAFDRIPLTCTHVSGKKLRTWFLTELSYLMKTRRSLSLPTHLQIETTNRSNLRCPVCHVVTDGKPKGFMSFRDFRKIIDEVGDFLLLLNLWGWGEPFLNPDIHKMIRYAGDRGIKTITSTNGHFFGDAEAADMIIDSGLDALIVALDGADSETYEKYRRGGDFDRVVKGVETLVRRKNERSSPSPFINLRMLVTCENEHQVPKVRDLARNIGVDAMSIKTLNSFDNEKDGRGLIPRSRKYRRFRYDDTGEPVRGQNSCKKLWNHPTIYWDGTVVPCDYYTGSEFALGNVFHDGPGFAEIWFGGKYRKLRSRFRSRELAGLRCEDCALNFADLKKSTLPVFHVR